MRSHPACCSPGRLTVALKKRPMATGGAAWLLGLGVSLFLLPRARAASDLNVTPAMLTFPAAAVGVKGVTQRISVLNVSSHLLSDLTLTMTGPAAADFSYSGTVGSLAPGQTETFDIAFKPTAGGTRNAVLVMNASLLAAPVQVPLTGSSQAVNASCSPDQLDFASVPIGQRKSQPITCRNGDGAPLALSLSVDTYREDWDWGPSSVMLPGAMGGKDGTLQFNATFRPTVEGRRPTHLLVELQGSGLIIGMIFLAGVGLPPQPILVSCGGAVHFGDVDVGHTATRMIICRSQGVTDVQFSASFAVSPQEWTVQPTEATIPGANIGMESDYPLAVTFAPLLEGMRTTTLLIKNQADGKTLDMVSLDGAGKTGGGCAAGGGDQLPGGAALGLLLCALACLGRRVHSPGDRAGKR